jgi:hypothetical protein
MTTLIQHRRTHTNERVRDPSTLRFSRFRYGGIQKLTSRVTD